MLILIKNITYLEPFGLQGLSLSIILLQIKLKKHNTHDFIFYAGLKIEVGYTVNQRIPIYYF